MAELLILSGKLQGRRMTLPAGEVVIGRDEDCQIRMGSTEVSRHHCRLRVLPVGISAEDLGSRNGSYVNDVPISGEVMLKPGDILRVGPMTFQVPMATLEPAPAARAKPPSPAASDAPVRSAPPGSADAGRTASRPKKLTDDDIASWLTDEEQETADIPHRRGDTTIVTRKNAAPSEETAEAVPVPPPAAATATPSAERRKTFRNVQEEAADIIRRHHEALRKKSEASK